MKKGIKVYRISATSKKSNPPPPQISSPYHSPVLASRLVAKVRDLKTMIAGCGLKLSAYWGKVDTDTWLLKTAQLSLSEDLTKSSPRLPASGIMRNGQIWAARCLVSSNRVEGFLLLPTPMKGFGKKPCSKGYYFGNLPHTHRGLGRLNMFIRDGPEDGIYPNPELCEVLMCYPVLYSDWSAPVTLSYL
mgnify:CR=1 FL=1